MAAAMITLGLRTSATLDALVELEEVFGFKSPVDDGLVELRDAIPWSDVAGQTTWVVIGRVVLYT
jgi:hypothetical protein